MGFFKKIGNRISLFFSKIFLFVQKYFINTFKDKILLKKVLFTLLMMVIFVVIGTLTLPGLKVDQNSNLSSSGNEFFNIFNTIGGGGLRQFSLVSLGLSPFITASLIMTFAQTKLVPPIQRLAQSGPHGRIKINFITHGLTFVFALIQGIVIIQTLTRSNNYVTFISGFNTPFYVWVVLPFVLVAGTYFSLFISEQITHKGVGNGTSMLILAGVLIQLPSRFTYAFDFWVKSNAGLQLFKGIIFFVLFLITFVAMMFIVSFFYQAERRVPIQYIGVGRAKNVKDLSYLPLKLNPAGVMPIIFASMIISFPMMIVNLVNDIKPTSATLWMMTNFTLVKPIGLTIFAVSIFLITIFLGLQQSRIDKIVEDFSKNSTYIPGIRPGEQTEDYLMSIVLRLSVFSAFYLTIIGIMQYVAQSLGANPSLVFDGTSLIILVSVSIETIQQMQARYKTQNIFKSSIRANNIKFAKQLKEQEEEIEFGGSILW